MYGTITLYCQAFQNCSTSFYNTTTQSYNPDIAKTTSVWAVPVSIASTQGIAFALFSSGYLDVSVLRVCLIFMMILLHSTGLPHSEIFG